MKNSNCKNKIFNTKQNNGITLIALILTIIVLMILAVVAISAVNDGGIIQHAQDAKNEHTIAQEKEEISLAQSEWTLAKYSSNNPSQTFKSFMESKLVDTGIATKVEGNDNGPLTVKMKSGNFYTVTESGEITSSQVGNVGGGSGESGEEMTILAKYIFGPDLAGRPMTDIIDMDDFSFKDDEETVDIDETQTIAANFITSAQASNELGIIYFESQGITYKFGANVNSYLTDKEYGVVNIYEPEEGTRVGKYVEDENGDTWRIIYDDSTHGLQMVSTNTFQYNNSDFYLGYNDTLITDWTSINTGTSEFKLADLNGNKSLDDNLEKSIYSYNQAIETLNTACENLFKENGNYTRPYIQDVRCVGSNSVFANKNSENTTTATSAEIPLLETLPKNNASQAAGIVNGKGYGTDNNYETDFDRMVALGINGSDEDYWLASRVVYADSGYVYFDVRYVGSGGYYISGYLWYVSESGALGNYSSNALRPVVSLSSSIQFSGEGTEANPYTF